MLGRENDPEFDRIKAKFENIQKELTQVVDEARKLIKVQIDSRLRMSIRNAANNQDIITGDDRSRYTHFAAKYQELPEIITIDLIEKSGSYSVRNLDFAKHVLNEFRPIVWNKKDPIYYARLYESFDTKIILKDPTVGTVLSIMSNDNEDITESFNKYLENHRDAIAFILKNRKQDLDYLYNGVLQHSDKRFGARLGKDFYSGDLNYLLIKNALALGPVKKLLLPFYNVTKILFPNFQLGSL